MFSVNHSCFRASRITTPLNSGTSTSAHLPVLSVRQLSSEEKNQKCIEILQGKAELFELITHGETLLAVKSTEPAKPTKSPDEVMRERSAAILQLREQLFEVFNENTDEVFGQTRQGVTSEQVSAYVKMVQELYELNGNKPYGHHSGPIFGDMRALEEGREVPDLIYNRGSIQCG